MDAGDVLRVVAQWTIMLGGPPLLFLFGVWWGERHNRGWILGLGDANGSKDAKEAHNAP